MKNFFKKFFVAGAVLLSVIGISSLATQQPAHAASGGFSCRPFLGMVSWDCHIGEITNETELQNSIWLIAANILTDIAVIAAYLVLSYVIYGGYLYMFSSGDPSKVTAGKKTLTHAFIGLAIVILSNVILNAIRFALLKGSGAFSDNCAAGSGCVDAVTLVKNLINWVIGIAGVVSAIFVVVGGVGYVPSAGDPGKLQKAKNTIIYALIGLAVVALSEIIVTFVSNIINDANPTASANQTLIAKEYHEN